MIRCCINSALIKLYEFKEWSLVFTCHQVSEEGSVARYSSHLQSVRGSDSAKQ